MQNPRQTRVVSGNFTVEFDSSNQWNGRIHKGDQMAERLAEYLADAIHQFMDENTSQNVRVAHTRVEADYHVQVGTPSAYEVTSQKKRLPRKKVRKGADVLALVPNTGT